MGNGAGAAVNAGEFAAATLLAAGLSTFAGALWWLYIERGARNGRDSSTIAALEAALVSQQNMNLKLQRRLDVVEHEIDALREERTVDRTLMAAMKSEMDMLYDGVKRLIAQIHDAGLTPVWQPPARSPSTRVQHRADLVQRIVEGFNIEEINSLAYDVDIGEESFAGETAQARARTLVELAARRKKLAELERRVDELRPQA